MRFQNWAHIFTYELSNWSQSNDSENLHETMKSGFRKTPSTGHFKSADKQKKRQRILRQVTDLIVKYYQSGIPSDYILPTEIYVCAKRRILGKRQKRPKLNEHAKL